MHSTFALQAFEVPLHTSPHLSTSMARLAAERALRDYQADAVPPAAAEADGLHFVDNEDHEETPRQRVEGSSGRGGGSGLAAAVAPSSRENGQGHGPTIPEAASPGGANAALTPTSATTAAPPVGDEMLTRLQNRADVHTIQQQGDGRDPSAHRVDHPIDRNVSSNHPSTAPADDPQGRHVVIEVMTPEGGR